MKRTTDIEPSWEVFDACQRCGAEPGQPCRDLRKPTWARTGNPANPHPGRKKLPK